MRIVAVEPATFVLVGAELGAAPPWRTLAPDWTVGPVVLPPRRAAAASIAPEPVAGWGERLRIDAAEAVSVRGARFDCGVTGVVRLAFDPPLAPGRWRIAGEFRDDAGAPALLEPRVLRPDATSPLDALAVLRRSTGATYAGTLTLAASASTLLLRPREQAGAVTIPRLAIRRAGPLDALRPVFARLPSPASRASLPVATVAAAARRPRVSIVTATRDAPHHLARFLASLERTAYAPFDLTLVDNGTTDAAALDLLTAAAARGVRVLTDRRKFNFAALSNGGAADAAGEILVFANNDVEFVAPGWLDPLVAAALDPSVGVAGARLLYPDGRVQHAGIVLAGEARIRHAERFLPGRSAGADGRQTRTTEVAAVTGALMAIRADLFHALGGFDVGLAVLLNDADLCLRARARGLRNLLVPAACAIHHESATIGPRREGDLLARGGPVWAMERALEAERFRARWGRLADADPCYPAGYDPLAADFRRRLEGRQEAS